MAEVYKAEDTLRNHAVAVKVLYPHLANDPQVAERFRDEVVILDRLSHDHVVRFYSFEQSDELAFLVMEFVEGAALSELLPLQNLTEIQRLAGQICSALSYSHKLGYLHRDIKPGNILVTADGKAKVSDFGIAKIMGSVTMTSGYIGTQYYMSPEQCRLEKLDQRSDIYAFGVMLYEMSTGVKPFRGDRVDPKTDVPRPSFGNSSPAANPPEPGQTGYPPAVGSDHPQMPRKRSVQPLPGLQPDFAKRSNSSQLPANKPSSSTAPLCCRLLLRLG